MIFMMFCLGFALLYKPLGTHPSHHYNYLATMAIYFGVTSLCIYLFIAILKMIPFFSSGKEWTFLKEITAIVLVLLWMGIIVYFMGFIMEEPGLRWNIATLADSCEAAFLVGIIPFGFFTLIHYRHLLLGEITKDFEEDTGNKENIENPEEKIQITSQLKKEDLAFYPHELLYIEADGNYVIFYLSDNKGIHKTLIRNSIGNIERQLNTIPYYFRTHRTYIVNLKKIRLKKGNSLGYRLKFFGSDLEIPVSRQKVELFDRLLNQVK